jgi:hypothetical protein
MASSKTCPRQGTRKYASPTVTAVKGLSEEKKGDNVSRQSAYLIGWVVVARGLGYAIVRILHSCCLEGWGNDAKPCLNGA